MDLGSVCLASVELERCHLYVGLFGAGGPHADSEREATAGQISALPTTGIGAFAALAAAVVLFVCGFFYMATGVTNNWEYQWMWADLALEVIYILLLAVGILKT